jgi:hypothetical protein
MLKTKSPARPESKTALIQKLLSRKNGADVIALQSATGWQPHSVRSALSGLRKAGYTIERSEPTKLHGTPTYRITSSPQTRQ